MSEYLVEVLKKEIYAKKLKCGPNHEHISMHPKVSYAYGARGEMFSDYEQYPYITPDNFFHPEIKVVIDFTHQFTLQSRFETLQGKRPVAKETLERVSKELMQFVAYYFDYVLSYGKTDKTNKDIRFVSDSIKFGGFEEVYTLPFLNIIMNYFITSINVQRSRNDIGSCTVTLRDNPNYRSGKKTNLFLNKALDILNQIFVPFLPIMVWAKGRLYKDWWFPIFDGYIMTAQPATAQGFTTITLNCRDVLELARISHEMINPAIIQIEEFRKQTAINIFSQPLFGLDDRTIFNLMFHGGAVIYDPSKESSDRLLKPDDPAVQALWKNTENSMGKQSQFLNFTALGTFGKATEDSKLTTPDALVKSKAIHKDSLSMNKCVQQVSHTKRQRYTSAWGRRITPYRIFNLQAPQIFTSEFSSRLDTIRNVAGMVYNELYVDGYGTIHYHPMRLANEFLKFHAIYDVTDKDNKAIEKKLLHPFLGSQFIGKEEIINDNSMLNVEELVTFLRLFGINPVLGEKESVLLGLVGSAIDEKHMQRFGYRRREVKNALFNYNPTLQDYGSGKSFKFLDLAAESLLRYANAELYTRSSSIIFRPEFDIALPVYFIDDNNVFYVQNISHDITIGDTATTTINANMGRKDFQSPPDLLSFILTSEKMYNTSGKYYIWKNEEDDIEVYHRQEEELYKVPFKDWVKRTSKKEQDEIDEWAARSGIGTKKEVKAARKKEKQEELAATKVTREQAQRRKEMDAIERRILGGSE